MENQLTNNENALRLFFTEDVFLVKDELVKMPLVAVEKPNYEFNSLENNQVEKMVSQPGVDSFSVEKIDSHHENVSSEAGNPSVSQLPKMPKSFKFLGGNKKSVLILVNDHLNDVSTEQGRDLLRKIVKAVDLSTPDFAVVNYAQYEGTNFVEFHEFFKPVIMLSFGVEITDLKLDLQWNNEIIQHETTKIIFAPNLHQLDSDLAAKKLLWGNLQKIV